MTSNMLYVHNIDMYDIIKLKMVKILIISKISCRYIYTNALHDALIQKKGPTFWQCWRSKFTTSSRGIEVDGCTDSTVIADNFTFSNYFKKIYTCNDQTRADKLKAAFYKLRNGYCGLPVPCDLDFDTFVA